MSRPIGVIAGLSPIKLSTRMVANPLAGDSASPASAAASLILRALAGGVQWPGVRAPRARCSRPSRRPGTGGGTNVHGYSSAGGIVGAAALAAPMPDMQARARTPTGLCDPGAADDAGVAAPATSQLPVASSPARPVRRRLCRAPGDTIRS